ncbi:glycosyltransferase family 9 protein [Prolixibacter sp. SD074]|jgi:heptosyltransferase-2|uniref:glycosyltransferase family 9 protein n=1 Tax=Prolixibacter sp. SD074 TaxID=2652391 RepID=UPI00127498AB|nr:glycosyltransferase family 9 protein [Prolixibacter sp. SD074]GET30905.1 heptosyltransferase [Prolixibacter sp. SD074]
MKLKILVIQQKRIGDVLLGTVICNQLRRMYPEAQIDYMVYAFTREMAENNPNIDNIIVFNDSDRKVGNLLKFAWKIRKAKYDIVIDAYTKMDSWVTTRLSGAKKRISYKKLGRGLYYNILVDKNSRPASIAGPVIEQRLALLEPLKKDNIEYDPHPRLYLTDEEKEEGKQLLQKAGVDLTKKVIVAGIYGSVENKTYPEDYMLKVMKYLMSEYPVQIILNYFPNQKDAANAFAEKLGYADRVFTGLTGKSLRELARIVTHADAYIGNDCGHTNLAKALEISTFTIFSPFISRESWGIFDDGKKNLSVHLNDFKPELIQGKSYKLLKQESSALYRYFLPEYVISKLKPYLNGLNIS